MKKWLCYLFVVSVLVIGMGVVYVDDSKMFYFYNWIEYVLLGLLEQFIKEIGIKVIYLIYELNEIMYVKFKIYKDGVYDLVVLLIYFVDKMCKEGMLQKIDKSKLINFSNFDLQMLNKLFDLNNDYFIFYIWGVMVIGVNSEVIDLKIIISWVDLWKLEYKSSLLLIDDVCEVFQMVLCKLGYFGNIIDLKEIEVVYNELKKLMFNVVVFNFDNLVNLYMEGEVNFGMVWNGLVYVVCQVGILLEVIWLKEGGIFWMDSLLILVNVKNVDGVLKLINFLLCLDVVKQVVEIIGYLMLNFVVCKMFSLVVVNDKLFYLDVVIIEKGEWQNDVGSVSVIYEEYYQKLKVGC